MILIENIGHIGLRSLTDSHVGRHLEFFKTLNDARVASVGFINYNASTTRINKEKNFKIKFQVILVFYRTTRILRNQFSISNILNIGINHLILLHLSFYFTTCLIFFCGFIFLLIIFHIPLCNVRQPYKGCPFTSNFGGNETVWRMRTNNVKRVYYTFDYI